MFQIVSINPGLSVLLFCSSLHFLTCGSSQSLDYKDNTTIATAATMYLYYDTHLNVLLILCSIYSWDNVVDVEENGDNHPGTIQFDVLFLFSS